MKLFTYGTLKQEYSNHHYLKGSEFIGISHTIERYPMIIDRFPYLLDLCGIGNIIEGELYEINDVILKNIDQLEGHPSFYIRKEIIVQCKEKEIKAFTYFKTNFNQKDLQKEFLSKF